MTIFSIRAVERMHNNQAGKIGLAEIENTIERHPAVTEGSIIRVPDKNGIKQIKAFIGLKERYNPNELLKKKIMVFVQNNLSPDAVPKDIEFCEKIPKSKNGKIPHIIFKAWELGLPISNASQLSDIDIFNGSPKS